MRPDALNAQPPTTRTRNRRALFVCAAAIAGSMVVWVLGLRDFSFNDYEVEAKPAVDHLLDGDVADFLATLPGYSGAVVIQAPFAFLGKVIGPDHDLWAWRGQAIPGLILLTGLGAACGSRVVHGLAGRAGLAWGAGTAFFVAAAPFAVLALQTGHAEELLVSGLAVLAVVAAARGNAATAGALAGLATVAKPWAVIVIPIVLLAAVDRRNFARSVAACVVAAAVLMTPAFVGGGLGHATGAAHTSTAGIFKPDNLFWFAGETNANWQGLDVRTDQMFQTDASQAAWAQRLEPAWAATVSHPLIVAFAVGLALLFLRVRPRSGRRDDLLLLLAAVCWWRCLLDTWNVHYYALGALVALAAWESFRGRPPLLTAVVTSMAWATFQIFPASVLTPDVHTVLYLAWALPLGVGMILRVLAPAVSAALVARLGNPVATRLPTLARWITASQPRSG